MLNRPVVVQGGWRCIVWVGGRVGGGAHGPGRAHRRAGLVSLTAHCLPGRAICMWATFCMLAVHCCIPCRGG